MNNFNKILRFTVFTGIVVVFNLLFWQERLGANLAIFSLVLMGAATALKRANFRMIPHIFFVFGILLSAFMVILIGSATAKFALIASGTLYMGGLWAPEIRSVHAALANGLFAFLTGWLQGLTLLPEAGKGRKLRPGMAYLRVSFVPLIFLTIFFMLFLVANPKFNHLSSSAFEGISDWFYQLNFSWARLGMILLGMVFASAVLWNLTGDFFSRYDLNAKDRILRIRRARKGKFPFFGLNRELRTAVLMLVLVNILALIVNGIDISWIWFGFTPEPGFEMSQFVHEGTYVLIVSILLSMAIMFWFFRGNLNFYQKSKTLRILSYVWIAQNAVMVISVFLRNYHFVAYHGLAYRRIGVFFFLLLTLYGLWSLYGKIRDRKSFYFVIRTNAWAAYALVLLLASVNWDMVITRHNIAHVHDKEIETSFLLALSPKVLPTLLENRAIFGHESDQVYHYRYPHQGFFNDQEYLDRKVLAFKSDYEATSWLSWSVADAAAYRAVLQYLQQNPSKR